MLEGYHVQFVRLWVNNLLYLLDDEVNSTQIDYRLVQAKGKDTFNQPKQTLGKRIPNNEDHTCDIPTTRKEGREVCSFN